MEPSSNSTDSSPSRLPFLGEVGSRRGSECLSPVAETARPILRERASPVSSPAHSPSSPSTTPQRKWSFFGRSTPSESPAASSSEEIKEGDIPRLRRSSALAWFSIPRATSQSEVYTPGEFQTPRAPRRRSSVFGFGNATIHTSPGPQDQTRPTAARSRLRTFSWSRAEAAGLDLPLPQTEAPDVPPAVGIKACKVLAITNEVPRVRPGVLLPNAYRQLVQEIRGGSSRLVSYKQVQDQLIVYEQMLTADKGQFRTYGARQQAIAGAAQGLVQAIKNYQISYAEKAFLLGKIEKKEMHVAEHLQTLIDHIENSYLLPQDAKLARKKEVMGLILAGDLILGSDMEFVGKVYNLLKLACEYRRLHGESAVFHKVRSQIRPHLPRLTQIINSQYREFFNAFGNDLIIELAFTRDPVCIKLHDLFTAFLNGESSSENHRFLDEVQKFLEELHEVRLPSDRTRMPYFFKEMNRIYALYITGAQAINLTGSVKEKIDTSFAQIAALSATAHLGQAEVEQFYTLAETLFISAQAAIKRLNGDALNRLKASANKSELISALLVAITSR